MTITLRMPDGVPLTAQQERQAWAAVHGGGAGRRLGGRSGFRVDTPSNVLTASSTTWTLGPCAAMIDPGASTHQGMYGWSSDANVAGPVTAADATYARKDIVYIQINDSSAGDGSGALTANVLYAAGVPSASPVAPALGVSGRERSFLVGTITVPASGGGSPSVVLNPARYAAAGAPLPVSSADERDALSKYNGLTVRRLDLANRPAETWDGAAWVREGVKTTIGQGSNTAEVKASFTSFATGPFGDFTITLPAAFPNALSAAMVQEASPITNNDYPVLIKIRMDQSDRTKIVGRCYRADDAKFANSSINVTYIAWGY